MTEHSIFVGAGNKPAQLLARYGNRHGLIAGATGTGKTISLKVLVEGFSRLGVPSFVADMKGDMAGLAMPGTPSEKLTARLSKLGIGDWAPSANPVVFWDLFQNNGHPLRATVSEIGPLLLSRMLELNDVQSGVLDIAFAVADKQGLLLLDLDDLRSMLNHVVENRNEIGQQFGLVSPQTVAAIQRQILSLSREGGEKFFGEPALDLNDLLRQDFSGRGAINILSAESLLLKPRLYSTALLWLLSELFENLPEVGDQPLPKLVFFFDEAHLLFADAPKALVDRIEQMVRLIRSKGVGVYFCTQSPSDLPDNVLAQLNNRVQHALRAATPREQKAVKAAAETFVANPALDVAAVIGQLEIGEALVSMLDAKGAPTPVERVLIAPPRSRFGAITPEERHTVRQRSSVGGKYDLAVNRESAHELLSKRAQQSADAVGHGTDGGAAAPARTSPTPRPSNRQSVGEALVKSVVRSAGSAVGRSLIRGLLGSLSRR